MGFFSDLFKFENNFSVGLFKDIKDDPLRLITGIDPLSTGAWNAVTGSDKKPLVNVFGSPGEKYYDDAKAKGINTGAATNFHAVADTVAGIFGAQGIAGIGGGAGGGSGTGVSSWFDSIGDVMGDGSSSNTSWMKNIGKIANVMDSQSADNPQSIKTDSAGSSWLDKIGGVIKNFDGGQSMTPYTVQSKTTSVSFAEATAPVTPSSYEITYGGLADQYAKQFGVPTDIFRSAIRRVSDFNPAYTDDENRKGIAGLFMGADNKKLDPYNMDTAFKSAALLMKETYDKTKNWGLAEESFVSNTEVDADTIKLQQTINGMVDEADAREKSSLAGKKIWEYSLDDFKNYLASSAWSILFIVIGFVLIIASLYVVVVKSGDK